VKRRTRLLLVGKMAKSVSHRHKWKLNLINMLGLTLHWIVIEMSPRRRQSRDCKGGLHNFKLLTE